MNDKRRTIPEEMDLSGTVPPMPESFRRRIQDTCAELPEHSRAPVWKGALTAAACLAAALILVIAVSVGRPEAVPDTLHPLTQGEESPNADDKAAIPEDEADDEAAVPEDEADDEADVPEDEADVDAAVPEDVAGQLKELYALVWPFENTVYPTPDDAIFEGTVYLYEDTFDPYYHVDPEKCGAGTKDNMIKTVRQTAYRRYWRELCPVCAPDRDLELKVWLNEGGRYYHKEQECRGEVMQVHTTLKNAVEIYDVPELCRYCSELFTNPIDHLDEYIIEIDYTSYGINLNQEWAKRTVYLSPNGVYHYDPACAGETRKGISQQTAVQENKAEPCRECMGVYTGNLVVYTGVGEEQYHVRSICGEKQLSEKLTQYDAMGRGLTICHDCIQSH